MSAASRVGFSWHRWWAMVKKEFLQLRRDRITFGMIIGIPIVQLTLFGYAINTDPKHLPTGVIAADHSEFTRSFIAALTTSDYFQIVGELPDEEAGRAALADGSLSFVVSIPPEFTRRLLRGERPALLIEADATDPTATGTALAAVAQLAGTVVQKDLVGPLAPLAWIAAAVRRARAPPLQPRVDHAVQHRARSDGRDPDDDAGDDDGPRRHPRARARHDGKPARHAAHSARGDDRQDRPLHRDRTDPGQHHPARGRVMFGVPFVGNLFTLYAASLLFIACNLTVGITLSSLAQNQLQAMQLTFFYFLPNMLLSGFMFPFRGMPEWAQWLGTALPLTHFNRIVRGILLKGNGWVDIWPSIWPLIIFVTVVMAIALRFYRRTLD